jgi:catechol 2,3-dioxygenase
MYDTEHHTLSLTETDTAGVNHIGWRAQRPEHLELFVDQLEKEDIDVSRVSAGEERGQGEAIRFEAPNGHPFEIYYDVEKPDPPTEKESQLKARRVSGDTLVRGAPTRLDHVHLRDRDGAAATEWLEEHLGFQVNEFYRNKGKRWGTWLSVTPQPHDLALSTHEDTGDSDGRAEQFHHVSYRVETEHDLFAAADRLRENGYKLDAGPGQHAITEGKYLYMREPASDIRLELYTGGYLIFDPDWEPIEWSDEDIGVAGDHQWIGELDERMKPTIPY